MTTPKKRTRARSDSLSFAKSPQHWSGRVSRLNTDQMRAIFYKQYKVGDYASYVSGGEDAHFHAPEYLTILFYGPPGAGKSSLVNSMCRVVNDEQDYNPVAPMNDEDPGRTTRTMHTRAYPVGRTRDASLGKVEFWDTRGTWHVGHPEKDFANIRAFKLGHVGVGETSLNTFDEYTVSPLVPSGPGITTPDFKPVGGFRRRNVQLIVFVIDPSSGDDDQNHLRTLLRFMNKAEYNYQILLTKSDDYFEEWSNLDDEIRVKLHGIPANDTWGIENYRFDRAHREPELDHNLFYVFLKLVLAAELSLSHVEKDYAKEKSDTAFFVRWAIAFVAIVIAGIVVYIQTLE